MNKSIKISIRVIALFMVAIFVSKIPDVYPTFFGDWHCKGIIYVMSTNEIIGHYEGCDMWQQHNPTMHWGYQHYLFFMMGLSLFIIQLVDVVKIYKKD